MAFSGEAFFLPPEEDFFSLESVAHRRCALSIRERQIGELALIDGWH